MKKKLGGNINCLCPQPEQNCFQLKTSSYNYKMYDKACDSHREKIDTGSSKSKISKNASRNNYIIMREDGKRGK